MIRIIDVVIVREGDCLSTIAERVYGLQDWQRIYRANLATIGSDPDFIRPGMRLVIPARPA